VYSSILYHSLLSCCMNIAIALNANGRLTKNVTFWLQIKRIVNNIPNHVEEHTKHSIPDAIEPRLYTGSENWSYLTPAFIRIQSNIPNGPLCSVSASIFDILQTANGIVNIDRMVYITFQTTSMHYRK
jgi:hypothetical protein